MYGIITAIIEISLWFLISMSVRRASKTLMKMNGFAYYWITFIILTGFWEVIYITHGFEVNKLSEQLLETHSHVWFNQYDVSYVLPWKFSKIFYAEYGAYADREYMYFSDGWSHLIEGSHMLFVSVFLIIALFCALWNGLDSEHYTYSLAFAMGTQFMNSLLYMGEYTIQTHMSDSVNYNTTSFPTGVAWSKRPFMYINFLWMILPALITYMHLRNRSHREFDETNYYTRNRCVNLWPRNNKKKYYSINYGDDTHPLMEV